MREREREEKEKEGREGKRKTEGESGGREKGRERKDSSQAEAILVFCKLILEVSTYLFCHVLFTKSESLNATDI